MNGLAKAYFVWQSPTKSELAEKKKHIEYVRTRDGRTIPIDEWVSIALVNFEKNSKMELLNAIEEYVQRNCLWVKQKELRRYSIDCLLKESYKQWDDFIYQESINGI